jgi:hypothetical protein
LLLAASRRSGGKPSEETMIKPITRPARIPARSNGGFAETLLLHSTDDEDYSGFAPTQMFAEEDEVLAPAALPVAQGPSGTSDPASGGAPRAPGAWATSRWAAKQEAAAHAAADKARAVIAAQRRDDAWARSTDAPAPRTVLARLRAAAGNLLPLFIGVSVTMALISALLPLFDKP